MLRVASRPRVTPLMPGAALGYGPVALTLGRRLLELPDEQLGLLRGLAGARALVVLGRSSELPWCDGIAYLAREPDDPGLFLPCASQPTLPAPLLARALEQRFQGRGVWRPLLVSLDPPLLLGLGQARQLERAALRSWLDAESAGGAAG